jgi:2-aminoadipate transaminase
MERRTELVRLADRSGVPLIEDDPYGQLRYEGAHLPPLVSIDASRRNGKLYSGNVIYLSTFSKTLAPGLRLAWVVAPVEVIERLAQAKQGSDLHTSTFVQMVAYEVARGGFLDRHVRHIRTVYRERRDAMLDALGRHFPAGIRWTKPHGGLFLWATLPPGIDASDVLKAALEQKVAFVPGANFYSDGSGTGTMRLNYSNSTPERIEEGIRRLGSVLRVILKPSRQSGRQLPISA